MSKTPLADELRARRLAREAQQGRTSADDLADSAASAEWLAADEKRKKWVAEQVAEERAFPPKPPQPKTLQRVLWLSLLPLVTVGLLFLMAAHREQREINSQPQIAATTPEVAPPATSRERPPEARASDTEKGMSDADVNALTTYAVALGRAYGCGIDASVAGGRVGDWLLTKVPAGSRERVFYSQLLMSGVVQARDEQRAGLSPDDCQKVAASFARFPWP